MGGEDSVRDQPGFFDVDDRLKRLSDLGDRLEGFRAAVDFEMFRPDLDAALAYSDGAQGGRPPFDRKRCYYPTPSNFSFFSAAGS